MIVAAAEMDPPQTHLLKPLLMDPHCLEPLDLQSLVESLEPKIDQDRHLS